MRILLVADPTSPNGEDAFCREISKRAAARGHTTALRVADKADAVIVNGPQVRAVETARAAGIPVVLRLIDPRADHSALARTCERVLVPSAYMRDIVVSWGIPATRVAVAPYAYDQIFAQQIALVTMRAARPSGFGLVTAGAVDEANRAAFETVLSAVSRLRLDAHLAVIGDGPALDALKKRAQDLMLGARVTFLGELPHPKKMEYLRAAKAYIEPSGLQGFPALALNAMSEGCPVVGAAAGSVVELVRDGDNGLLYRPGDPQSLIEQILNLSSTPGLSLKLIAAGVRTVEAHSWDATVAAALDAVESLEPDATGRP